MGKSQLVSFRLEPELLDALDELGEHHGGRSGAIRHLLASAVAERRQRQALDDLLENWEGDAGSEDGVARWQKAFAGDA